MEDGLYGSSLALLRGNAHGKEEMSLLPLRSSDIQGSHASGKATKDLGSGLGALQLAHRL